MPGTRIRIGGWGGGEEDEKKMGVGENQIVELAERYLERERCVTTLQTAV